MTPDATREELARQDAEVDALIAAHGDALARRPPTGRWSVAEHLEHLALMNGPYLRTMKEAVREADERTEMRRWRFEPLMGRFMIWMMKPPPKLRTRTLKAAVPPGQGLDLATAHRDFSRVQDAFRVLLDDMDEVDARQLPIRSPFATWMAMTLDQGVRLLVTHNRRHLWLAREAVRDAGLETR